jgi:outer membrane cobalamin receptor
VEDATDHRPLAAARLGVTQVGAAVAIVRGVTEADGTFRFPGLPPGRYRVRVVSIGYAARDLPPVEIRGSGAGVDLGAIALTPAPIEVQSLTVTAPQQAVQLAPDRNTYVVTDMPTTRGGTALDVLRSVPAVDVDIDNIVSLRGNSGVIVQINGRPSPLKPGPLGNFLAQLPADLVEKVEVVPNPSARENPEGVSGIINIVLKRKTDAGWSGGLTTGAGTTGHGDVGGNLGFQHGAWSTYGSYGYLRDDRPRTDSISRTNSYQTPLTYLDEAGARSQIPHAHTLTGSATYTPRDADEFTGDLVYTTRTEWEKYGLLYQDLDSTRTLTGLSDRHTRDINHETEFESSLGYTHTFAEGHELSAEGRIVHSTEGGPGSAMSRTLDLAGNPIDTTALERQTPWERPNERSAKLDYVRPLSPSVRMAAGYQWSLQRFHTTLSTEVFDTVGSVYLPDSTRINDFTYDQTVNAAYGMLDVKRGKTLFEGGLRAERATTQFHLRTTGATFANPYNSLFPSALVIYTVDDAHQVKLSYSTRIRRPDDTDVLDPTPHYADPLNIRIGNPHLKPEYIRALELGLQRTAGRTTLQVTPFWRHTIDAVRQIRTIDTSGVSTLTFANISTSDAYGADATLALTGGPLSGFLSASAFRQVSDAANVAPGISAKTFGWNSRANLSYRVSRSIDVQSLLSYQAPMTVEQGRIASRTRFSLAARKKLIDDQMSVTLRVIDPFNTSREVSTTNDPLFTQVSNRRRAIRGLLVGVNWTFGHAQRHGKDDLIGNDAGGG